MKTYYIIITLFFLSICTFGQRHKQPATVNPFSNNRLRADITICGNNKTTTIKIEEYVKEPNFSSPQKSYIDKFNYGQYLFELEDIATNKTLFSNGFNSLFNEWQPTTQAVTKNRCFGKTLIMPFPKELMILKIFTINNGSKNEIFCDTIKPKDITLKPDLKIYKPKIIYNKGASLNKLDILVLGDGYGAKDMADFYASAKQLANSILAIEPYKQNRQRINFWAICPISNQTGISYNHELTPLGCAYNAIETDRYLYSTKNRAIADVASQTHYDQIIIITNSNKYGGGGIYNDFAVAAAGVEKNFQVMVHEFGHSFAGLADEYAFYNANDTTKYFSPFVEPWEPNITNLVNFDVKWRLKLAKECPIPTADSLAQKYPIGVYQGAGYQSRGIFRASFNCIMRSNDIDYFCPVCNDAIDRKIKSYTK